MQLLIDEAPCEHAATTIGEAIAVGATHAESLGRVIVEVVVDGDPWTDEQLGSPDMHASSAVEVRLVSAEPATLLKETLDQAATALDEADGLQRQAAEAIQADRTKDAMADLAEAIEIWLNVQAAVTTGCTMLGVDLPDLRVGAETAATCVDALTEQLHMLRDALTSGDPIGLSDTLLYEMPDVHARWRALLGELRRVVDATLTGGDA